MLTTKRFKNKASKFVITFILSIYAIISIYPIFYIFINSFKTRIGYAQNRLGIPSFSQLTLGNYLEALSRFNIGRLLLNTFIVTMGGVILCIIASFLAAYAVTKLEFKGISIIFVIIVATLMIPHQTILYPLFQTLVDWNLRNRYIGLVLVYASFGLAHGTYLIGAYLKSLPNSIMESAVIDGANQFQIITKIVLPMSMPAIATLAILSTAWMWNSLLLPLLLLPDENLTTIMVKVGILRSQYDVDLPLIAAILIISLVPVLIMYLIWQRQLIKGMTAGATKE